MELPSRPYQDECFQLFQSKLHEYTVRPNPRPEWKPRSFVLYAKLRDWLHAPAEGSKDSTAAILLEAVYNEWHQPVPPLQIGAVTEKCLFTFCILIELKLGELIYCFRRCGIVDASLPMRLSNLEDHVTEALKNYGLSIAEAQAKAPDLARRFDKEQWKYFAVRFINGDRSNWESRRILPFIDCKLITGKGATAEVYEIAVPDKFLDDGLKDSSPPPAPHPSFPDLGPVYRFALKVFEDGRRHLFNQETSAYQALGGHKGMVKYLGDYSHVVDNARATHNILLEYAENDLAEYFFRSPPVLGNHIEDFWTKLLRVPSAIQELHGFEMRRLKSGKSTMYKGWHADIKPDNILLVRGEFKLADPGLARFQKLQDGVNPKGSVCDILGGTTTYGAPERLSENVRNLDHAKSDMWSLGCVLSEAATWVALGRTGVRQYSLVRQSAISSFISSFTQSGQLLDKSPLKRLQESDCFHNGERVLSEVTAWHEFLRTILRPTDCVTRRILDMIDKQLFAEAQHRSDAKTLLQWCNEQSAANVFSTAPMSISKTVQDVLELSIEQEADEISKQFQSLGDENMESRKAAKSSNSFLQISAVNMSTNYATLSRRLSANGGLEQQESHISLGSPLSPSTPSAGNGQYFRGTEYVGTGISRQSTHHNSISSLGATSTAQSTEDPKITVFDAYYYHQAHNAKYKHKFRWLSKAESARKDDRLAKAIVDRDLIFLVDNGESMLEHWSEVMFLLEILVTLTWNIDPDGVELMFTHGPVTVKGERKKKNDLEEKKRVLEEFKNAMNNDEAKPTTPRTDMSVKLHDILFKWIMEFERALQDGTDKRSLTVIVLTDGKWKGMETRPLDVDKAIVKFNEQLRTSIGSFQRKRPVSISFVSFGHDPDAIYRLRRLDNDLGVEGVPDIIDTEPSDGDIYQMLLGSISDDHDHRNDPVGETSPQMNGAAPSGSSPVSPLSTTISSQGTPSQHRNCLTSSSN